MEHNKYCQSCSMPLDRPEMAGTEKDGSPSTEYCKYCYQQGEFTSPDMTMEEMQVLVKEEMKKRHIGDDIIKTAVGTVPYLKRWKDRTLHL